MGFWEPLFFWIFALGALFTSCAILVARNPLYCALWLIADFFCFAGLYVLLAAHFLAVIQVLVYGGAIMVLFLFIIMLLNLRGENLVANRFQLHYVLASVSGVAIFLFAGAVIWSAVDMDEIEQHRDCLEVVEDVDDPDGLGDDQRAEYDACVGELAAGAPERSRVSRYAEVCSALMDQADDRTAGEEGEQAEPQLDELPDWVRDAYLDCDQFLGGEIADRVRDDQREAAACSALAQIVDEPEELDDELRDAYGECEVRFCLRQAQDADEPEELDEQCRQLLAEDALDQPRQVRTDIDGLYSDAHEDTVRLFYADKLRDWQTEQQKPSDGKYPLFDPERQFEVPPSLEPDPVDERVSPGRGVDREDAEAGLGRESLFGTFKPVSIKLVNRFVIPFELVAVLLLAAIVGAVILAKRRVA